MNRPKSKSGWRFALAMTVLVGVSAAGLWSLESTRRSRTPTIRPHARPIALEQALVDPLDGGVAWLNTGGPIKLRELKGKIVILDFWTYCCINCHHMLPILAKLEQKYPNELVVIGVHTPKFEAEHDTDNIRRKVHEYNVKHPVINDANQTVWNAFDVHSWPTLVVVGPKGTELARQSGELPFEVLDQFVAKTIAESKADLDLTPVKFFPENEKPYDSALLYPGKVVADAASNRLFISDTGHNRIVVTDLAGQNPTIIGDGSSGFNDGPFEKASFNRPQGTVLVGEMLYIADTENHAIRAVDLKARTVTTIAGTGQQAHGIARPGATGPGKTTELSSPWDLAHVAGSRVLYIAMAGPHQIWKLDLATDRIGVFAGTGAENITDGPVEAAAFAQPSGLATDGAHLFVADSEVSAVRTITLTPGTHRVGRIVGEGLFEFGDQDGRGAAVRLQHCLGLAYAKGKLYIADTYNNKVKVSEPLTRVVKTLVGSGKRGDADNPPTFYQPGGLSVAGDKLYVADTNNSKIRVVHLPDNRVSTLTLGGLSAPRPRARRPVFLNAKATTLPAVKVKPTKELTLDVTLPIPEGFKLNDDPLSRMPYVVESTTPGLISKDFPVSGKVVDPPSPQFRVTVPLEATPKSGDAAEVKLSVSSFVCSKGSNLCTIKSFVWTIPMSFVADGEDKVAVGP